MTILPIFSSHYSLGSSILTLDEPPNKDKPEEVEYYLRGPKSIIQLAMDNNINPFVLVESNMSGFVKAYKNSQANNLQLRFGLKLIVCNDMKDKSSESLKTEHKIILFTKNSAGYKRLLKIYSEAATKGFYYRPRIDSETLKSFWNNKDLVLVHPFYYSFLHRNLMYFSNCQPDYSFTENIFFLEDNSLPFNYLIKGAIDKFCSGNEMKTNVQSIYYENDQDFKAFVTYKCINERQTLDKPNFDHLSCANFSLENWSRNEKK